MGGAGTWGCRVVAPDLWGWAEGGPRPGPPSGGHRLERLECASCVQPKVPASQQGPPLVFRDGRVGGGHEAELATEFVESRAE